MAKALIHIMRTYLVTFRYLKKNEIKFAWYFIFAFILWFIFSHIIF
jgi:hypothetical protein